MIYFQHGKYDLNLFTFYTIQNGKFWETAQNIKTLKINLSKNVNIYSNIARWFFICENLLLVAWYVADCSPIGCLLCSRLCSYWLPDMQQTVLLLVALYVSDCAPIGCLIFSWLCSYWLPYMYLTVLLLVAWYVADCSSIGCLIGSWLFSYWLPYM